MHAVYDFTQDAGNDAGIGGLLRATSYEIESEVFNTDFEDILEEQAPETQAVVRLTVMGFPDSEIAERLKLTSATVRKRRSRFGTAVSTAIDSDGFVFFSVMTLFIALLAMLVPAVT